MEEHCRGRYGGGGGGGFGGCNPPFCPKPFFLHAVLGGFGGCNPPFCPKILFFFPATQSYADSTVTPNFVLPGNGPADLIRLPEMVRRTKSRCLKWSTGPFQAAQNGPTLPVLVR